jgi:tRNA wybutosine-synthesizing protein 1
MHSPEEFYSKDLIVMFKRQHYKLFGHSAVKLCHWTKASLYRNKPCYKQQFYGIQSHRCLQFSPAVAWCDQNCAFCWRPLTEYKQFPKEYDEPSEIIDEAIKQQRILLSGYGEFREKIGQKRLDEANNPNNAAISLAGEPTLYPKISALIEEFHRRNFSTFLVSNGLHPKTLENTVLPTQLYISLEAANEGMHKGINHPLTKDSWQKLNQTLALLPSLNTRKAIRITAIKRKNMSNEKEFAALIQRADPDFVEIKAYMFVGYSRKRLSMENMPLHSEVRAFAEKINNNLNYNIVEENKPSRVVLLKNPETKKKLKISRR